MPTIGHRRRVPAWTRCHDRQVTDGDKLWESDTFDNDDFDYATAPIISDMNHDGSPEVVVGRVILNPDGTLRGKGNRGRGSWGKLPGPGGGLSEASVPAVTDLVMT